VDLSRESRAVAIGNFDGVHRGHQAVLASVAADAHRQGLKPCVLTFSPHPRSVLGRPVPPVLTCLDRKRELIHRIDPTIDVRVWRFDLEFASRSPEEFATSVLHDALEAAVVVVGHNFRFGRDRAGGFDDLAALGDKLGFETRSHDLVGDDVGAWSSSRIRGAIAHGELADAERMLGRPHMLSGIVVSGDRRGRTLGFPTCNLAEVEEALPPFGVYAVLVDRLDASAEGGAVVLATGVANIGVRPTVGDETIPRIEVHLFDLDADLYGARLCVHLVAQLRAEQRFDGLDALRAQIARDATAARARLEGVKPDPAAAGAWR
jgi:riboflavin kinase / FMN adenylyltransferase